MLFYCGTQISLYFQFESGIASLYLPTATALVLINWWGPARVLPALFLNALFCTPLWGIPEPAMWALCALPETVYVFLSWYIFSIRLRGDYTLPNYQHLVRFLIFGIIIPLGIEVILLDAVHLFYGNESLAEFESKMARNFVGEFAAAFGFAVPALYFGTPYMQRWKLLQTAKEELPTHIPLNGHRLTEALLIYAGAIVLSLLLKFDQYWFVDGVFALYLANRFGFGAALFANLLSLTFTYLVPLAVMQSQPDLFVKDFVPISLGNSLLFVFAAITGRVVTDMRLAEQKLTAQNRELETANQELDRFVYSVSHDLASPLKSILGLINISRLEPDPKNRMDYLDRMEGSVRRLESFISDVLDYSRVNRLEARHEPVLLKNLCEEITGQLHMPGQPAAETDYSGMLVTEFTGDHLRMRIVLNNLLSNAWKFRKTYTHVPHRITIRSNLSNGKLIFQVSDNGEGIRPEYHSKIFGMFFRGGLKQTGSGLGLYIAREAVEKMGGTITVQSAAGEGATFTVEIPVTA